MYFLLPLISSVFLSCFFLDLKVGSQSFSAIRQRGCQRRHNGVKIADDPVGTLTEDGGLGVAVNGNNRFGSTHAHHVLGLAGNADCQVETGRNPMGRGSDQMRFLKPTIVVTQGFGCRPTRHVTRQPAL